jgi:hypothetical protein
MTWTINLTSYSIKSKKSFWSFRPVSHPTPPNPWPVLSHYKSTFAAVGGEMSTESTENPPTTKKKRGAVVHDWTTSGNGKRKEKKKSGTVTPVSKWVQAGIEIRQDRRSTSLDDTVIVPPYLSRRYFIVKQKQKIELRPVSNSAAAL